MVPLVNGETHVKIDLGARDRKYLEDRTEWMNVICVKHRDGWCATRRRTGLEYRDRIPTLCQRTVICAWGIAWRKPTCPACLARLEKRKQQDSYCPNSQEKHETQAKGREAIKVCKEAGK